MNPKDVSGSNQVYLGGSRIDINAFDGVIELRFRDVNGEEFARRLRIRVAGDDNSGEIIDARFHSDEQEPF